MFMHYCIHSNGADVKKRNCAICCLFSSARRLLVFSLSLAIRLAVCASQKQNRTEAEAELQCQVSWKSRVALQKIRFQTA